MIKKGVHGANSVYAADLDGDGDMDVLSASYHDHKIAWYENLSDVDATPPTPNPSTWFTRPYFTSATSIRMVATAASDPSGVEYYFDETSGSPGGTDSGWQSSRIYEDTGLSSNTSYVFRVKTRDKSPNQNAGSYSSLESATTDQVAYVIYAVDSSSDSLYMLDLQTGDATVVGPLHTDAGRYTTPIAMAVRPADQAIFVWNNSPDNDRGLSIVDPTTGIAIYIGGSVTNGALAFDANSILYSQINQEGPLATVNQATGQATSIGGPNLPRLFGLDFNPSDGFLYGITPAGLFCDLLVIDPTDGTLLNTITLDTSFRNAAPGTVMFDPLGRLHGTTNWSVDNLFEIDPATGTVSNVRTADYSPQGMGIVVTEVVPTVTDLGQIDFLLLENLSLDDGSFYYQIETAHDGMLSLQVDIPAPPESARLKLYDANPVETVGLMPLAQSTLDEDGNQRIDWPTSAGTVYYAEVYGTNTDFDVRIANLVHHDGTTVTVFGTDADDTFTFAPTGSYQVTINGVAYHFDEVEVDAVTFDGGEGYDTVNLTTLASNENDNAELWPDHGTFTSAGVTTTLTDVDSININGGTGEDSVIIHDSANDDILFARAAANAQPVSLITMADTANSYSHRLDDFEILNAYSTSGIDTASLFDSDGPDKFISHPDANRLRDDDLSDSIIDFNFRVKDFQYNHAYAKNGGVDLAEFHDKDGQDDNFKGYPTYSKMFKGLYQRRAKFFENVVAYATPGDGDYARLFDSDHNDSLIASPTESRLFSNSTGYDIRALYFDSVLVRAKYGFDTAEFIGGSGDDLLQAKYIDGVTNQRSPKTMMMDRGTNGGVYEITARKFDKITADGGSGVRDIAKFWDTLGDDRFVVDGDRAAMYGPGNELIYDVLAFEQVNINRVYGGSDTIEKNPPINFDLIEN